MYDQQTICLSIFVYANLEPVKCREISLCSKSNELALWLKLHINATTCCLMHKRNKKI